jgi:hypothetical protein
MTMRRLSGCVIEFILITSLCCAGGCSSSGSASFSDWRGSVQKYIDERGKGDPAVLREVTWPQSRRTFSKTGADDPRQSQDVRGVLLGLKQIGAKRWFIFIAGVVDKEVVQDIRVEAMNLQDDDYTWRTSSANPKALAMYRDYQTRLWKGRFPGRQSPPAQYTVFPQEADVFNVQVDGGRVTVTHQPSGARWDLTVDASVPATRPSAPAR